VRQRTFAELYADVARLATAMKAMGIQPGDRVVGKLIFTYYGSGGALHIQPSRIIASVGTICVPANYSPRADISAI